MDIVKIRIIRSNSENTLRFLMMQTISRLELAPCGDKKETRKRIEEELFAFLKNLPQGDYRINSQGIKRIAPNAKDDLWGKNYIPAKFRKQDSPIPETIQAESPENSQ